MPQDKQKDAAYINDFQTPPNVAKYMVSLIPAGVKTVLEPTPGIGNIVNELYDYNVTDPIDYWKLPASSWFDCIVGNLPFSSKTFFNCPAEYEGKGNESRL